MTDPEPNRRPSAAPGARRRAIDLAIVLVIAAAAGLATLGLLRTVSTGTRLVAIFTPLLLAGFHLRDSFGSRSRGAFAGLALVVLYAYAVEYANLIRLLIQHPPEWDFLGFWLAGRVAVDGLDFYDPQHAAALARPLRPSAEFTREILDAGFWYPPPSMFLFAPLGWFSDIHEAIKAWFAFHGVLLAASAVLLWRIILRGSGSLGLLFVTALLLSFYPTLSNIGYAQTNFVLLFALLLFWARWQRPARGAWIGAAIFVKPYIGILFLHWIVRRDWWAAASAAATVLGLSLASLLAFGTDTVFAYRPAANLPEGYFSELANGSLYAVIWRFTHALGPSIADWTTVLFATTATLLLAVSVWLVRRLDDSDGDWGIAVVLSLGLLLYPNTGGNYCSVLLIPMLLLWDQRQKILGGAWIIGAFICTEFVLLRYKQGWSNFVFVAIAASWLVFAGLAWLRGREGGSNPPAHATGTAQSATAA